MSTDEFDLVLHGGWVVDGTGAAPFRASIGIRGDRITRVGAISGDATARSVVDVTGRYLMPGMIDTHIHADTVADTADLQLAALRQGVTTVICGQDGLSIAPASAATIAAVSRYFAAVNGPCPPALAAGASVADFLDHYDRHTAINVAYLAPAGTVRVEVMGYRDGPADRAALSAMRTLVEQALSDGAVGLSTGLEYVPGSYATAQEIVELLAPLRDVGAVHVSHMRGYEADAWRGIAEIEQIARTADVASHISHLHGPANMIRSLIDDARAAGADLTFDSYPYLRGSTIVAMVALPPDIQVGGPSATMERLADPETRRHLAEHWFPSIADVLPRITLSYLDSATWRWAEGMSLPVAAAEANLSAGELVCELVLATHLGAGCVFAQPPTNTDDDVRALMRHEAHMVGSDGILLGGRPHPRAWGAFATALGRHTRQLGDWTWGEAALHTAGHPARRFGLSGRGQIAAGYIADVAVVDPVTVAARADYTNPRRPAVGIDDVLVSGRWVLRHGVLTGEHAGRGLRRGEG